MERGEYCSISETAVQVVLYDSKTDLDAKHFAFKNELTVSQCKTEICEAFDICETEEIKGYSLYRYDGFGEPAFYVKDNKTFFKNNISSGDVLALRSNKELSVDEKY